MYSKILAKAKTKDQREKMKEEIDMLLNSLYVNQPNSFENTLSGKVREDVAILIREELKEGKMEKRIYLDGLLKALSELEVIKLTLGFEPTTVSIDKFWSKIVEALEKHVVLDIIYKPSIMGGAYISFDGEYKDFSLHKLLDAEVEKGAASILKVGMPEKATEQPKNTTSAASAAPSNQNG